jgi:hypothetical protein
MLLLAIAAGGCRRAAHEGSTMPLRPIAEVLADHTPGLLRIDGVTGTGESAHGGHPVIVVFVTRRTRELARRVPASLEGWPVELRETGTVRALGDSAQ